MSLPRVEGNRYQSPVAVDPAKIKTLRELAVVGTVVPVTPANAEPQEIA
jgi:hypothetical protein